MTSVSVVIPCHNCEKWVRRAVNSVLSQTYTVAEILLIENNSTDNTLAVLKEFEKGHPELIKVYSKSEKGACAARNFGLFKATGEWIQFLDADDEILPSKIGEQIKAVESEHPDVIIGDYIKVSQFPDKEHKITIVAHDDPWIGLINSTLGITSANLWKRESLLNVNGLDEELTSSQEYDLMFRLLQAKSKFVVKHHIHTYIYKQVESISTTNDSQKRARILVDRYKLRLKVLNFMKENNLLSDLYKQETYKRLFTILMSIREESLPAFKEQQQQINFTDFRFGNKLNAYYDFICCSSKIKYRRSNLVLRLTERYFYMFTRLSLLKY